MTRLCLDTSAYSHFKRGDSAVVEAIGTARWVGVPAIALGELRTGFLLGSRSDRNERELRAFLDSPFVHTLDVDDEAARIYAEIVVALRRAGTPVPTNDIWIAALAARDGATVLTSNQHFAHIQRASVRIVGPT